MEQPRTALKIVSLSSLEVAFKRDTLGISRQLNVSFNDLFNNTIVH